METTVSAKRFIGKVMPNGQLSLPEETAKQVGCEFEVILLPLNRDTVFSYAEKLAAQKGFSHYTEDDIERIIHESRGVED